MASGQNAFRMLLKQLTETYIAEKNSQRPIGKELAERTCGFYFECVRAYETWLGRDPSLNDFEPTKINQFLASIIAEQKSAYTAKCRRTGLTTLMRFARKKRLIRWKAKEVRPVLVPTLEVSGYNTEDMQLLLCYTATLRHTIRNTKVKRSNYWGALVPTKWEVGLRIGDFPFIPVSAYHDGRLKISEHKTGKESTHTLDNATANAIEACIADDPDREMIWHGLNPKSICKAFKRVAEGAGLPGTSKWVRAGGASEVERDHPGSGWRFLRHSCPQVFERHYRVKEICDDHAPKPPSLFGPDGKPMLRLFSPDSMTG